MKFGRLFSMTAEGMTQNQVGASTTHLIQSPLTVRFQLTKTSLLNQGSAVFRIYNLAAPVRADLYKDFYEQLTYKQLTFAAGYQADSSNPGAITLPVIFKGDIQLASSFRQGPDWITELQAADGMWAVTHSIASLTKPAPYLLSDLARDIIGAMPRVEIGTIGKLDLDRPLPFRGITLNGNAWDLIARNIMPVGGRAFINNEKVNIVQQWEYLQNAGTITEISADTGMIGSPRLQSNVVHVRMIFEPRLEVYQKVHLTTQENRMSGDYVVLTLQHQGTISGAVAEDLTTDAVLFQPDRELEAA